MHDDRTCGGHRGRRDGRDGCTAGLREGRCELIAPAKINLSLLVGPRRRDGYHEVFSLMVPVTLADRVVAERTAGDLVVESGVSPGEDNLAARAVRAMERWTGRPLPVRITIEKRIPAAAGLGGGSSDAAAALRAVMALYDLRVPSTTLYRIAAGIGADVPFFLWTGAQIAMGRGSVVTAVDLPGPLHLVLAAPDLPLPTAEVYAWRDEDVVVGLKEFAAHAERLRAHLRSAQRPDDLAAIVGNDLERHVVARRPLVGILKERLLQAGALAAAMSGSGSAVFGLFASPEEAGSAAAELRAWPVGSTTASPADGGPQVMAGVSPAGLGGHSGLRVFQVSDLQPLLDHQG